MRPRPNLKNLSIESLREVLAGAGHAPFRADQIAAWLYARGEDDLARMTDLGVELRTQLASEWDTRALALAALD